MPRIARFTSIALVLASFTASAADPVVQSVTATVAGPYNARTVSVTFTFSDSDGDACHIALFGHDAVTLAHYPMRTFAEGDIYNQTFTPGTHTVTWLASEDRELPAPPVTSSNLKVYVQVSDTGRIAPGRYLVIDVSEGPSATSYPVEYKAYVNVSLDAYKTDKIVLRELPDGSYAGVYEVTQRQYERVTGATPSYFGGNPQRPVEKVSWNTITGTGSYGSGFIRVLRDKAGLAALDLPSSTAWEYACRAGTTYNFNDYTQGRGKGASDIVGYLSATLGRLGWYGSNFLGNSGPSTNDVGGKQPNTWGLYDMHGNVFEWSTTPYSGSYRVIRGGNWGFYASDCTSGSVYYDYQGSTANYYIGFRLVVPATTTPSTTGFDQGESLPFVLTAYDAWLVDKDSTGPEDGLTWATAYKTIQPAIDAAFAAGGTQEVWVAEGVYGEARTSIVHPAPDDVNTGSVVLKEGVEVYGGFIGNGPGGNETARTQRNWTTHVTTIDGSTARDGSPAYHVVVGAMSATLDGFTVTGGDAGGGTTTDSPLRAGGGMFNKGVFMTIANCILNRNHASLRGGGMYNLYASPGIVDCSFFENSADSGGIGGVCNETASPSFSDCRFMGNAAIGQFSVGAVYSGGGSAASFLRCYLITNSGDTGGAHNHGGSMTYTDCIFKENVGSSVGAFQAYGSTVVVRGCIFEGNSCAWGSTASNSSSQSFYEDCRFSVNNSYAGGAVDFYGPDYSSSNLVMKNCIMSDNMATSRGGAVYLGNGTPNNRCVLTNCTVANNTAVNRGGGLLREGSTGASLVVANSIFWNNTPDQVLADGTSVPDISYCDIQGGHPGTGNTALDPLFLDISRRDYRLSSDSPCIDMGRNANTVELGNVTADIVGTPRGYDGDGLGRVTGDGSDYDMGAYEAGTPTPPVIEIAPANPQTLDPLVCTVTTPSVVSPGTSASYVYTWTSVGMTITHGPKIELSDTLSASLTEKGQTWTCTVRAWDGLLYSAPVPASVMIGNTPPGPLTLSIPPVQSQSLNLRCELNKSPDPDGDVLYGVQWHLIRGAVDSVWVGPVLTTETYSLIDTSHLIVGDRWYCRVTYGDGSAPDAMVTSSQCEIVNHGTTQSFISAALVPASMTLGDSVTISGQIFPMPNPGANVFFESTSPSGTVSATFPEGLTISGSTYTRTFHPTEASEGRAAWSVKAWWPGDTTYMPATSVSLPITVLKAQPTLSLSLSVSSVPMNYGDLAATVTLDAPVTGSLRSLLAGRSIRLWIRKPKGDAAGPVLGITAGDGRATFPASSFATASPPIVFNAPGTWKFQAEFEGDDNFRRVTSAGYDTPDAVSLTVKDRAGYAIIVVGKLDTEAEGLAQHAKTTDFVYRSFRERGFAPEDIYYMRQGPTQPAPDIFVSNTAPSQAGVKSAIETWALGKMSVVPGPLYVVFVDHGSIGKFYVYSGSYGEDWYIDPVELSGYFTTLQSGLTAYGGAAGNQSIVFVYGCCHSGSFIPAVSGPRRTIVASAGQDELSNRGVVAPDGLRDGEFFTTELFRRLRDGRPLKESFEGASAKTLEYTAPQSAGAWTDAPQNPELDDNGDGVGGTGTLSHDLTQDGGRSASVELGYGFNAGRSVGWLTVSQTVTLASAAVMPDLVGVVDQTPSGGATAWIEIKSPAYAGGTLVDPSNPADSQQTVDLTRVSASGYEGSTGAYTWTSLNALFTTPGTYQVFYYITDGTTHETSSHMLTTVYRMQPGNRPPAAVSLLYPEEQATVMCTTFFAWEPTTDPDGDPATYRFEAALDAGFTTGLVVKDRISATVTQLTVTDGLLDGHAYYWRVLPVDAYGMTSADNVVRTLAVNNQNPALTTALMGVIRDSVTRDGISGVTVSVLPGSYTTSSGTQGNYFVSLPVGTYGVSLWAAGYIPQSRSGVSVTASIPQGLDVELTPTNAPFRWGDVSGDGKVGTVDASLILQWVVGLVDRFPCNPGLVYPQFPPLADVSDDGILGLMDASLIIQKRVGLIPAFPADHNGDGFGPDAKRLAAKATAKTTVRMIGIPAGLTVAPGATVDVPIVVDDATGVLGYLLRIEYDAVLLDYVESLPGSLTSSWGTPTANPMSGRVVLAGAGAYALTGSGSLAILRFRVKDTAQPGQSTALRIAEAKLNDGEIATQAGDGAIATAISGDIGGDGKTDAQDVQLVINAALGLSIGTLDADVDKSGRVDALDIQKVINAALGIV